MTLAIGLEGGGPKLAVRRAVPGCRLVLRRDLRQRNQGGGRWHQEF